jgi:uncharacterized protein YxjI
MRYLMKQKAWSLRERFNIQNDLGEDVGYLEKAIMAWGDTLVFYDVAGKQVATIKQRMLSWRPTYDIETAAGTSTLEEQRHFLARATFTIATPSGNLGIEGDWSQHEYFVTNGHASTIATVSKQWWTWTDTFGVEILPGEDVVLILAATVVVDLIHHHQHSS